MEDHHCLLVGQWGWDIPPGREAVIEHAMVMNEGPYLRWLRRARPTQA